MADTNIMNQQQENLNSIQQLQTIQRNLFTDLETLAASEDVNSPQSQGRINSILGQMNELTNIRSNLFNMIKGNYSFLQQNVNNSRDTLVQQYVALGVIENELTNARNKFEEMHSNRVNSERMVEINSYYASRYEHHTRIMKWILLMCVAIIIVIFIMKIGWFSINIASLIIIGILGFGLIKLAYMINDLRRRNNINYDRYDFPFDPNNVKITDNTVNKKIKSSPFESDIRSFCKTHGDLIKPADSTSATNASSGSSSNAAAVTESFTMMNNVSEYAVGSIQNPKKGSLLSNPTKGSNVVPSSDTNYMPQATYNKTD